MPRSSSRSRLSRDRRCRAGSSVWGVTRESALACVDVGAHLGELVVVFGAAGSELGALDVVEGGHRHGDRRLVGPFDGGVADEVVVTGGAVGDQRDIEVAVLGCERERGAVAKLRASRPPGGSKPSG